MINEVPLNIPNKHKPQYGEVICSKCEKTVFIPAVRLKTAPDPKGIIGQTSLAVMQVFVCMECGTIWEGPK